MHVRKVPPSFDSEIWEEVLKFRNNLLSPSAGWLILSGQIFITAPTNHVVYPVTVKLFPTNAEVRNTDTCIYRHVL